MELAVTVVWLAAACMHMCPFLETSLHDIYLPSTQVSSISGSGSSSGSECDPESEDEDGSVFHGANGSSRSRATEDNSMTVQGSGRVPQLIFRSEGV